MTYYVALGLVVVVFIWRVFAGFRKGLIGELISLLSLVVAAFCLMGLFMVVGNYINENITEAIQMLVVLAVIGLVYKLASLLFSSLKLITKLPVIKGLDRLLGAALGAVEAVLILLLIIEVLKYFSLPVPPILEDIMI
ncbi:MAG: CvpA family protein [Lachnospiraceae bacterium]|jgi:uncharacterized membrane protein required for colicin V production|nr:CvpA family protein [Lachnospiraceae bacterium]